MCRKQNFFAKIAARKFLKMPGCAKRAENSLFPCDAQNAVRQERTLIFLTAARSAAMLSAEILLLRFLKLFHPAGKKIAQNTSAAVHKDVMKMYSVIMNLPCRYGFIL